MFVGAEPQSSHIWIANTSSKETKRMTNGDWTLPLVIPPSAPSSPFSWSPNGKSLLFVKVATAYSGDGINRSIQILNVADGTYKPLTTRSKFEGYPNFSSDSKSISYWYKNENAQGSVNELWITDTNGGEGKPISTQLDRVIPIGLDAWKQNIFGWRT